MSNHIFAELFRESIANACFREMAVGNTFGATALSSYGGFWISFGIVLTPGGFNIIGALGRGSAAYYDSFGFYLAVRLLHSPQHLNRLLVS